VAHPAFFWRDGVFCHILAPLFSNALATYPPEAPHIQLTRTLKIFPSAGSIDIVARSTASH
jgi:hypothetical protein